MVLLQELPWLPVQVPRSAGRPTDFAAAMDAMTASLRVVRDNLGAAAFREQLWGTTGFVPPAQPPQPAPPSPPPAGSPGLTTPVLVTVIAVPVAVCSLLVLLLAVIITHLRRNAKLQRSLLGHVLPPAAGDKATLVITDVQGSSKLWVRRLALDSSGYEWATEGDRQPSPSLPSCRVGWQRLSELYREVEAAMPAALTVLAGLRVRVGLHTGLAADEVLVQRRMGASSITYGGAALVLAKAVQGGQVTLSAATFVKLPVEELRAAGISVVHMGQHLVALGEGKGATALELYCACLNTPDHAHRLWALGPLRTLRQLQPGVLHAPYGTAAIAFMSVVGLSHLKAWNAELAKECVALYQAAAQRLLLHVSGPQLPAGYWVSSAEEEGMVLAAFPCSLQAQLEAADRLGLSAPGLQLSRPQQPPAM
ncbi:guanylyl and adenylyl cyclase family member [Haematococcus lacustris]|uniref:Guanylyl and adenylyl cyclase family member n=1 Tax=Haematococcus lacustris TaxID=44745 RepID=A0A699ZTN2_HAELA|nr:guanylyl and adenylyl cyclase family member [Haematococcus lacustris]